MDGSFGVPNRRALAWTGLGLTLAGAVCLGSIMVWQAATGRPVTWALLSGVVIPGLFLVIVSNRRALTG